MVQDYSILKDVDLKDVPQSMGVEGDICPASAGPDIDLLGDMAAAGDSCLASAGPDLDLLEDTAAVGSPSSVVWVSLVNGSEEILPASSVGSVGKGLVWEEASQVEEGWTKVKGKKYKHSQYSSDRHLRSHSFGGRSS